MSPIVQKVKKKNPRTSITETGDAGGGTKTRGGKKRKDIKTTTEQKRKDSGEQVRGDWK